MGEEYKTEEIWLPTLSCSNTRINSLGNLHIEYKGRIIEMTDNTILRNPWEVVTKEEFVLEDCIKYCKKLTLQEIQKLTCNKNSIAITGADRAKELYMAHSYFSILDEHYADWKRTISNRDNMLLPNAFVIVEPMVDKNDYRFILVNKNEQG